MATNDGIRIYDNTGTIINSFVYDTIAPWSAMPSVFDLTNEYDFYNGYLDQNNGFSWFVGCPGGSPGTQFIPCITSTDPTIEPNAEIFVSLYPNPANTSITLSIENSLLTNESTELIIHTVHGSIIEKRSIKNLSENLMNIELSVIDLTQGMYFIKIIQQERSITIPFVKF